MRVLFWFRKSEAKDQIKLEDPSGSIQCRITIDNIDTEIGSTTISCKKSDWNAADQVVIGKYKNTRNDNLKISQIRMTVLRLYDVLVTKYDYVSPDLVKEYFHSKKKFTYSLTEIKREFFAHRKKEVSKNIVTQSTYDVNKNYARHILDFCASQKLVKPIQIQSTFFTDLFNFVIDDGRAGQRMARKIAIFAKQMLKWSQQAGMSPQLSCFNETLPGKNDSEDNLDTTHLSIPQIDRKSVV